MKKPKPHQRARNYQQHLDGLWSDYNRKIAQWVCSAENPDEAARRCFAVAIHLKIRVMRIEALEGMMYG